MHTKRRGWVGWAIATWLGVLLAILVPVGVYVVARPVAHAEKPQKSEGKGEASAKKSGGKAPEPIPVTGKVRTIIEDFGIDDPQGHRVLSVKKLTANVDASALREPRLRMTSGTAEGLELVLRKGKSGRVSLSEAFHGGPPPSPEKAVENSKQGMLMDIGPLDATDIRLRVAMGSSPVIIHLRKAKVRVVRDSLGDAPRIFLSDMQGTMVKPHPLPNPIEIHDGTGVVDLQEDPLVDMRVRVCISNGELRLNILVPQRAPNTTKLISDSDGFMGCASAGVLNVVDWFKDAIEVENGSVKVDGDRRCDGDKIKH